MISTTLLSVILGLSELLQDHVQPGSEPDDVVNRIIASGKRGRALTRQILEFSRAEPASRTPVSLGQVACEALDLVRVVLRPCTDLSVDLRAPNATIVADKGQIAQVITNLTINASDSLPDGVGRVGLTVDVTDELRPEIAAARAMGPPPDGAQRAAPRSWSSGGITWTLVGAVPEGPSLSAAIHDTGAGISDAQLQQIFEPYYTTKPQDSGTGLGLAIARRIVLDHGGAMLVRSRAGLGSTFEMILPAARG
ncbi:MAG TPA: ATP-binding protein [Steroidobacteraceae bacterium]|nr:ATP-binding protein [Steroidobacteraceae bacterium]